MRPDEEIRKNPGTCTTRRPVALKYLAGEE